MDDILKSAQNKQSLLDVLGQVTARSCPQNYNFHLHTQHSDGQSEPIALFQQAMDLNLRGLAITDHHSVGGFLAICDWLSQTAPAQRPQLWTGVEITASLLDEDVHILGFAFEADHGKLQPYLQGDSVQGPLRQAEAVIDAIHQSNGVAVLAHPVRYRRDPEMLIEAAAQLGIDGVEAFYCYGSDQPWRPSEPQTSRVQALGDRFNLLRSCGTDTHGLTITHRR